MDGFHWTDLLVLLLLGLLFFGPKRLPELGASLGSALRELRHGLRDDASPPSHAATDAKLDERESAAHSEPGGSQGT